MYILAGRLKSLSDFFIEEAMNLEIFEAIRSVLKIIRNPEILVDYEDTIGKMKERINEKEEENSRLKLELEENMEDWQREYENLMEAKEQISLVNGALDRIVSRLIENDSELSAKDIYKRGSVK